MLHEEMSLWLTASKPSVSTAVLVASFLRCKYVHSAIHEVRRRRDDARGARGARRYVAVYRARTLLGVQVGDGSVFHVLGNLLARGRREDRFDEM